MKKSILIYATAALIAIASCNKFIDEELVANLTNDYYNTDQGLEDLVKAAYEPVRFKFQYEQAYCLWNFGTDEYREGDQTNFNYFNKYDSRFTPNASGSEYYIADLWNNNYDGINRCNLGLERIPGITGIKFLRTPAEKRQRLAELHFLRGFYYFQLVQQFGAIPITLSSTSGIRTDFVREPVPQVYEQIIIDLKFAADSLAGTSPDFGRATNVAAAHFLAKAYLTRGSASTEQRGQKVTDMDSAAFYAEKAINNAAGFKLADNYKDLWDGVYATQTVPVIGENGSAPIGDYAKSQAAQKNKEILFAAQWNQTSLLKGRFGNQSHLYYIMAYENEPQEAGMVRDIFNGRPFRRLRPTDYTMDVFDRKNDSRFYKSFVSVYYSNTNSNVPRFTAANAPNPSLNGKLKFGIGDTAMLFVTNSKAKPLPVADSINARYKIYARYVQQTNGVVREGFKAGKYLTLVKFLDPFRSTVPMAEGDRDGVLARLGETYLIAAEAFGRKASPDYTKALFYINELRKRAAYKANEQKPPQYWQVEGGTPNDLASTYPSLMVTEAKFEMDDPAELYPATAASKQQRFIHFILNERCRELCGELYRWEDLVRTETLVERTKLFNLDATGIQAHHKLRPIPQREIDLVTLTGIPLNDEQKKAYQNSGY